MDKYYDRSIWSRSVWNAAGRRGERGCAGSKLHDRVKITGPGVSGSGNGAGSGRLNPVGSGLPSKGGGGLEKEVAVSAWAASIYSARMAGGLWPVGDATGRKKSGREAANPRVRSSGCIQSE